MFTPFSGTGPRHLVFSTPSDLYVLPSAMVLVQQLPPAITSATGGTDTNGNRVVTISGSNLSGDTRILFDGVPAPILSANAATGILVVAPPPAPASYQTNIVALNPDGQSSLFLGPPASYTYDWVPAGTPALTLSSTSQTAGTEAMVEITASNMTFSDGQISVGFGSSDVVVEGIWVVSPTLVRVNVFVAPGAQASDTVVSVFSGLQTASLAAGFHILTSSSPVAGIGSGVVNADPAQSTVFPGSTAILPVYSLPASATAASVTLTLNGVSVPVTGLDANNLTFQIPASFAPAPAIVQLQVGGVPIPPVFVVIQPAPPVIQGVTDNGQAVDTSHPANPGDTLTIGVLNLGDAGATVTTDRLQLMIGGSAYNLVGPAQPSAANPQIHTIQAVLSPKLSAADNVPIVVSIDGRASLPFYIAVAQ